MVGAGETDSLAGRRAYLLPQSLLSQLADSEVPSKNSEAEDFGRQLEAAVGMSLWKIEQAF